MAETGFEAEWTAPVLVESVDAHDNISPEVRAKTEAWRARLYDISDSSEIEQPSSHVQTPDEIRGDSLADDTAKPLGHLRTWWAGQTTAKPYPEDREPRVPADEVEESADDPDEMGRRQRRRDAREAVRAAEKKALADSEMLQMMRRRASGITRVQASDEADLRRSATSQDVSLEDEGDLTRVPKRVALGVGALVVTVGVITTVEATGVSLEQLEAGGIAMLGATAFLGIGATLFKGRGGSVAGSVLEVASSPFKSWRRAAVVGGIALVAYAATHETSDSHTPSQGQSGGTSAHSGKPSNSPVYDKSKEGKPCKGPNTELVPVGDRSWHGDDYTTPDIFAENVNDDHPNSPKITPGDAADWNRGFFANGEAKRAGDTCVVIRR